MIYNSLKLNKIEKEIVIDDKLHGILALPKRAKAFIIFAHGSGSSRYSPRNNFVARELQKSGLATLLLDLLTEDEEADRGNVFNVELLADRLISAKRWAADQATLGSLPIGYFGASTGAGAALLAAVKDSQGVYAVVSRGGRPDLANDKLLHLDSPTLLIVGSEDNMVVDLNRQAYSQIRCEKKMELVPGATHLFQEPGALEQVARLSTHWFNSHLSLKKKTKGIQRETDLRSSP
jgi:putative phosphoribosyl transferase